jgi:hypothetical protein
MVVEKRKEFKEFEEYKEYKEHKEREPGARRRQPWSVPRSRGRGEQGDLSHKGPSLFRALSRTDRAEEPRFGHVVLPRSCSGPFLVTRYRA